MPLMREEATRKKQGERLRKAREAAGYRSARDAALSNRWPESTYRSHEAGTRTIGHDDAERYARRFRAAGARVSAKEILFDGESFGRPEVSTVPIIGYVGAGAQTHYLPAGELERIPAPDGATSDTVAVEVRGESLGSFFDHWLIFYDQVHRPVTPDLIGKLCVIGLEDGRILVKKIQRSRSRGLFHLISQNEAPILDVEIEWAAEVKWMAPNRPN